jgi:predicted Zn-dependent protease
MQLQLAQVYSLAYNLDDSEEYYQDALKAIDASIAASPERVLVYFMKANILISKEKYDEALMVLNSTIEFNQEFPDTYCQLFKVYNLKGDTKNAWINGNKCVELNGSETLNMSKDFLALLEHYYSGKDWPHALIMAKQLVVFQANNPQAWNLLSEIYANLGDEVNSRTALLQANTLGLSTSTAE